MTVYLKTYKECFFFFFFGATSKSVVESVAGSRLPIYATLGCYVENEMIPFLTVA